MARDVIVGYGHGFELFLSNSRPEIERAIAVEMDLFALQHQPIIVIFDREAYPEPRYLVDAAGEAGRSNVRELLTR